MRKILFSVLFLINICIVSKAVGAISLSEFSKFNVSTAIPTENKATLEKIEHVIEHCFSKKGNVKQVKMIVQTAEGEAINFEGLDGEGRLNFTLQNVTAIDGTITGLVKASLTLNTLMIMEKTDELEWGMIWSKECYLKGDLANDAERLATHSLEELLKTFHTQYKSEKRPTFIFLVD